MTSASKPLADHRSIERAACDGLVGYCSAKGVDDAEQSWILLVVSVFNGGRTNGHSSSADVCRSWSV